MPRLTYLQGNSPLSKTYSEKGVTAYPLSKNVSSNTVDVDNCYALLDVLKEQGAQGKALHTGDLKRVLANESRKQTHDRFAPTQLFILDVDSLPMQIDTSGKFTAIDVRKYVDIIVQKLPQQFQNATCLFQASSSFGIKTNTISMHVFWLLSEPVMPKLLKNVCKHLNLYSEFFADNIKINATGLTLSYPIDIMVNDAGRLCYIAPPTFTNANDNPFVSDAERYGVLAAVNDTLDIDAYLQTINITEIENKIEKQLRICRKEMGLPAKKLKQKVIEIQSESVSYITNPDLVSITWDNERDEFIGYNVHGAGRSGDSGAYWTFRNNPTVMYNFKGETAFDFAKADKEAYEQHIATYCTLENATNEKGEIPLVFMDFQTSNYFYALIDKDRNTINTLCNVKHQIGPIKYFCAEFGVTAPEALPVWNLRFDPTSIEPINWQKQELNRYSQPELMENLPELPNHLKEVSFGYGATIAELCPTIVNIIGSACGQNIKDQNNLVGAEEFEHFINWLAHIVQRRHKTGICFVFQGTQGTGKGLMLKSIIEPLLGEKYAKIARMNDLRDNFNAYINDSVVIAIDEFKVNGNRDSGLINTFKSLITEHKQPVRNMYASMINERNWVNWMVFTNDLDAVVLDHTDRRFRICPRQEIPLKKSFPKFLNLKQSEKDNILSSELPYFAAFLQSYTYNESLHLENEVTDSKQQMIMASKSAEDEFFYNLKTGNLAYFLSPLLEDNLTTNVYIPRAKEILIQTLHTYKAQPEQKMLTSELRVLYNTIAGFSEFDNAFGKKLASANIKTQPIKKGLLRGSGISVEWRLAGWDIDDVNDILNHNNSLNIVPFSAKAT